MSKTRFGKSLKTKMVHGVKSGNHSNPNVLRAARASGGSCGSVGGNDSRPSLSRPGRMRGRVSKKDGDCD